MCDCFCCNIIFSYLVHHHPNLWINPCFKACSMQVQYHGFSGRGHALLTAGDLCHCWGLGHATDAFGLQLKALDTCIIDVVQLYSL